MQLALNYSPQAEELLDAGSIDIHLFKCPADADILTRAQRLRPAYVHFSLNAGEPNFSPDWKSIEELMKATKTRFLNAHITADRSDYPDISITSQNPDDQSRILEKAIEDVRELVVRFGAENVIVENDTYHAEARPSLSILRPATEPRVIFEVVRETRCGLLLDIDHARVSSHYMGISLEEYVAQLPTDCLKELHMTGTKPEEKEGWLQSHHEMREEDWSIFDWALDQIRRGQWAHPKIYTFEYGGIGDEKFYRPSDKNVISGQVPILQKKLSDNLIVDNH